MGVLDADSSTIQVYYTVLSPKMHQGHVLTRLKAPTHTNHRASLLNVLDKRKLEQPIEEALEVGAPLLNEVLVEARLTSVQTQRSHNGIRHRKSKKSNARLLYPSRGFARIEVARVFGST